MASSCSVSNESILNDAKMHLDPLTGEYTSKSELKRRLKQREKQISTASKGLEKLDINSASIAKVSEDDLDPNQYYEQRSKIISELKKCPQTYPFVHKFQNSVSVPEYILKFENLENGCRLSDTSVSISGRIISKRTASSKLFFYDLISDGAKVQVMANQQYLNYF